MKNLISQAGTLLIVTVVALLVWLYAEDANVNTYTQQSVRVQFVLPAGAVGLVTPSEPITVLVDFDGSNGQYQQFDEVRDEVFQITLAVDQSLDLQTMEVDIRSQIEQSESLAELGINVKEVSPERVSVTFEKYVDVQLPIQIVQDTGAIKLATATFTETEQSPRVRITMLASQAQALGEVSAIARIDEDAVASLDKGISQQLTGVPLIIPESVANLPRSISSVDLLVTVADDRDTVQIVRRPILLSYPPSINERYIIELEESDRFITAFELEGPRDQIALLKEDPTSKDVWASVRLSNEEADAAVANGGVISKAVDIIAPRGVVLTSEIVRVSIKVIPRETPAP
ncbi:MAG: hypothetical protein AB8C95_03270 [Phycisphaeraceae bacterium]